MASPCSGELRLPAVFSDHAVLQRDKPVTVWGWADPGDAVTVTFGELTGSTKAAAGDGRWGVTLPAMPASGEPQTLMVSAIGAAESDAEVRQVQDVLVGEVWLCSGQSNMDWKVRNAAGKDALLGTASDYPQVRVLRTEHVGDFKPRDVGGRWAVSGDNHTALFSAVAYAFARELHDALDVPVGVLQSSVGGTRIQTWTPRDAFESGVFEENLALAPDRVWLELADREYAADERQRLTDMQRWTEQAQRAADESADADLPDPPAWPRHRAAERNRPASLHHGMIRGLAPYAIRGIAWYQGESNKGEGELYATRLRAMLNGWRKAFGDPGLPALIVHLPPYVDTSGKYPPNALPWLVDAQRTVSSEAGQFPVVISDLGNLRDIHPRNKRGVAERLARVALWEVHGEDKRPFGPRRYEVVFDGSEAQVVFNADGRLTTRDGKPPTDFRLAGDDRAFRPAEARLGDDGESVLLRSEAVPEPVAVRFAFDEAANPNLTDATGIPAMAFRTDDWPEPFTTQQRVTLPLWPDGVPMVGENVPDEATVNERVRNVSRPTVELFFPRGYGDGEARPAVLIFPGGGYGYLTIEKEGKAAARRLNEHGFIAGVVKYRAAPHRAPVPRLDGAQAVRLLRHHAGDLAIDPQRIGVLGFSAGGHVAACVSVGQPGHEDQRATATPHSRRPERDASSRPDFTVLVYPVVSMQDGVTHSGSRKNLLGSDPTAEQITHWSAELHVDANTPPAFLVHCANDSVSIANSEGYAEALRQHGVPVELLRFESGGHGFGLGAGDHPAAGWIDRAAEWAKHHPAPAP